MSSVRNREDESSTTNNDEIFSLTFGELRTATREALRELSRKQRRVIVELLRGIDATFEYPFMNDSTDYATERNFLSLITNCINSFPSRFDDEACQVSRGTITKLFGAIASAAASPVGECIRSRNKLTFRTNEILTAVRLLFLERRRNVKQASRWATPASNNREHNRLLLARHHNSLWANLRRCTALVPRAEKI